jgi:ABC-2 type transport system permease protein
MLSVALMLGFYASPVLYPVSLVASSGALPPWAVSCYQLNPMAGIIESYRVVLFEGAYPTADMLGWPACLAFTTLVAGAVTFRHAAPTLSDHL